MTDPHFEDAGAESAFRRVVLSGARAALRASGPARRAGWRTWAAAAGAGATAAGTAAGLDQPWWVALLLGIGAAASALAGGDLAGGHR
jgi:hypothetical protein